MGTAENTPGLPLQYTIRGSIDIENRDGLAQGASRDVIRFRVLSIHEQPIGSTVQKGLETVFTTGGCFNVDVEVEGVRAPDC